MDGGMKTQTDKTVIEEKINSLTSTIFAHAEMILPQFAQIRSPIAIAENDNLALFEWNAEIREYKSTKVIETPFPISSDMLAAFPLSSNDYKITVVLGSAALGMPDIVAFMFHEMVHCMQWEIGEPKLHSYLPALEGYQKLNRGNWELTYPFPYVDQKIADIFSTYINLNSLATDQDLIKMRRLIKSKISASDWDYLIWLEWKEGLARYSENKLRGMLNLPPNLRGVSTPFSRVSFYASGSHFIERMIKFNPELKSNSIRLFEEMQSF